MPTKNKREDSCDDISQAEKTRSVRDLLIRGEAAEISDNDELPSGVTHRIIKNNDDNDVLPQVERERFSIY